MIDVKSLSELVWNEPKTLFKNDFISRGDYKESAKDASRKMFDRRGKVRLSLTDAGYIHVFYNGDSYSSEALFDFAKDYLLSGANDFKSTLLQIAELYNVATDADIEQTGKDQRAQNAAALVAKVAFDELRRGAANDVKDYLSTRQFDAELTICGFPIFGALTIDGYNKALRELCNKGYSQETAIETLKHLHYSPADYNKGYKLVIPYYFDGAITGLKLRLIAPAADGSPKYINSTGLSVGGYSLKIDGLKKIDDEAGHLVVTICEGELDAIRLMQTISRQYKGGAPNVVAIGGKTINAKTLELLKRKCYNDVAYFTDYETDGTGAQKTGIIDGICKQLRDNFKDVFIYDYFAHKKKVTTPNYKIDAADYFADADACIDADGLKLLSVIEVDKLCDKHANTPKNYVGGRAVWTDLLAIYKGLIDSYEREVITKYIFETSEAAKSLMERHTITRANLADVESEIKLNELNARRVEAAKTLNSLVTNSGDTIAINNQINTLKTLYRGGGENWQASFEKDFEQRLLELQERPKALETKWTLQNDRGEIIDKITFERGAISIIAAMTSHGKTTFLMNAAINLIEAPEKGDEVYLYLSLEENENDIFKRFLKAKLGKDNKAVDNITIDDLNAVKTLFERRLKIIHTAESVEGICANIEGAINYFANRGLNVGGVFLDYIQLLHTDAKSSSARTYELKDVCTALADIAKKNDLPIIAGAQLNRQSIGGGVDTKNNIAPIENITAANVGESADIERIAHDLYFLWQTDKTPSTWVEYGGKGKGARMIRITDAPQSQGGGATTNRELKNNCIYIEKLKARTGITGVWGLFAFDGAKGIIHNHK